MKVNELKEDIDDMESINELVVQKDIAQEQDPVVQQRMMRIVEISKRTHKLISAEKLTGSVVSKIYGRHKQDRFMHVIEDIFEEYERIHAKESKLPSHARAMVVAYVNQIRSDINEFKAYRKELEELNSLEEIDVLDNIRDKKLN